MKITIHISENCEKRHDIYDDIGRALRNNRAVEKVLHSGIDETRYCVQGIELFVVHCED